MSYIHCRYHMTTVQQTSPRAHTYIYMYIYISWRFMICSNIHWPYKKTWHAQKGRRSDCYHILWHEGRRFDSLHLTHTLARKCNFDEICITGELKVVILTTFDAGHDENFSPNDSIFVSVSVITLQHCHHETIINSHVIILLYVNWASLIYIRTCLISHSLLKPIPVTKPITYRLPQ